MTMLRHRVINNLYAESFLLFWFSFFNIDWRNWSVDSVHADIYIVTIKKVT